MGARAALIGLVLACAAVLWTPPSRVPLLYDAVSYGAQGLSLAEGHSNTVPIGGRLIPGIYPVGVPLLISLPLRFGSRDLRHGVLSIWLCAAAAVALAAAMARRVGGAWAAAAAVLLLMSSGTYRSAAGNLWSQAPAALLVACCAWLFVRHHSAGALALAGLLAMMSLLLRFSNVGFPLSLAGAAVVMLPMRFRVALIAGMIPGAGLVLLHNWWFYGHPLHTGYTLWGLETGTHFSWEFLIRRPEDLGAQNTWPFLRNLLGLGQIYAVPVFLLAVYGVRRAWRERGADTEAARLGVLVTAAVVGQLGIHAPFSLHADLYLVPIVPLIAVVAGVGAVRLVPARWAWAGAALAALLLGWSLMRAPPPSRAALNSISAYEGIGALALQAEEDAVLVTAAEPPLVEPLFMTEGREILYVERYSLRPMRDLAQRTLGAPIVKPYRVSSWIGRQLTDGRPVYVDRHEPSRADAPGHESILPDVMAGWTVEPTGIPGIDRVLGPR